MSGPIINNYGGQVSYATDNSQIVAKQIIGESETEFEQLCNDILKELSHLKQEDADTVSHTIDMLKDELAQPTSDMLKDEPAQPTSRKDLLRNAVTLLAPMITIANGFPALAQNLQSLVSYIQSLIR